MNVRPEAGKDLEENIDCKLLEISLRNNLLDLKQRQWKQKYTSGTKTKLKKNAQERKSSTKLKSDLLNGRKYLQVTYLISS